MTRPGDTPLLDITEALRMVLAAARPLDAERVPLLSAHGRVLATDAMADLDQPAFDRAAMDGIALRAADATVAGTVLAEIGEAAAGRPFTGSLQLGTCVRIMTGAIVPAGADAVVPIERIAAVQSEAHVSASDSPPTRWRLAEPARPEAHIARRGSEVRQGDLVVPRGTALNGPRLGALASFGHAEVDVYRRPVAAVLPTGDEIVGVSTVPQPGQVRDSNRHALTGVLQAAGAHVIQHPAAADRRDLLAAAIEKAWQDADVLVLSGGVSAGEYDFVPAVLASLGATCLIHRIRIKPGKPFLFATRGHQLAFGLPGNPVSATVCCALFVVPALLAMQGSREPGWQTVSLPASTALPPSGPRSEVLPVQLVAGGRGLAVDVIETAGSADLAHFARAGWFALRSPSSPAAPAGAPLDVLLWPRP